MGPADLDQALRTHGVSPRVIAAMAALPRERFVPDQVRRHAWEDHPLPIGFGQTISQPSLVGLMIDVVDVQTGTRVLDVGTGSGYQAAALAQLGAVVCSIERVPELAEQARATLAGLELPVAVTCGDGVFGWPERAPFDVVLVAAAADRVPAALLDQLAAPTPRRRGGRLLMPVRGGRRSSEQRLVLAERTAQGVQQRELLPVSFVPLVSDAELGDR